MNYRSDIDGLRAIAILFVLLFHGGLKIVPSGFIGVDIFFVISGFLITSLIQNSLQNNHFSFMEFYNRRLWRLQPVLLCLILVTMIISLLFYLPDDLILFSKSARKTSVFISNVFFSRVTTGYFSQESNQLPLLHTWSLSVEWQCYFILPIVIYLFHRLIGRYKTALIYLLAIGFFCLSLYLSQHFPEKTYYQFPSRIFEFLIGSCVALSAVRFSLNKYWVHFISIAAVLTLIYIATRTDVGSGFPNWYALILCFATAALIAVGSMEHQSIVTRCLSSKPFVFIGLLSYSLYIWHWPVFALIRYLNIEETPLLLFFSFSLIFIIAYLSWKFIERPTRKFNTIKFGYTVVCLLIIPIGLTHGIDSFVKNNEGYPQRFKEIFAIDAELNKYKNEQRPLCLERKVTDVSPDCTLGSKNPDSLKGFMFGDSFSNHFWVFIDYVAKEANLSVVAHSTAACLALPGVDQWEWYAKNEIFKECHEQKKRYFSMIKANHYDFVIFGENWYGYLADSIIHQLNDKRSKKLTKKRIEAGLDELLQMIIASGSRPVLLKSIMVPDFNPYKCFLEHIKRRTAYNPELCEFKVSTVEEKWVDDLFVRMQRRYAQLIIIDPKEVQCPHGLCKADINGIPLFRDWSHISDYASYQLGKLYNEKNKNPFVG